MKCLKCPGIVEEDEFDPTIGICDTCGQMYLTKSDEEIEFEAIEMIRTTGGGIMPDGDGDGPRGRSPRPKGRKKGRQQGNC